MLEKIINPIKKLTRPLVFAGALTASTLLGGCLLDDDSYSYGPVDGPGPTYSWVDTQRNAQMHEGVILTSWWFNDYNQPVTDTTLEYLHSLGVESVSILTTEYQNTLDPTEIYPDVMKTPDESGIEHVVQKAKSFGMRTVLKPHVDPDDGSWRGYIDFGANESDWADWFANYRSFILHYAQLAEDNGIDMLVVGTELAGTTHRSEWEGIIDDIRAVYSGEIVYAADWTNYQTITWWNKLDYIGVDAYFSLTTSYDPTLSELVSEWNLIAQDLQTFSQSEGKQIIITEFGYQDYDGTNINPWWAPTSTIDEQEQADCYEAAFTATFNQSWIAGAYIWKSYYDPSQDLDGFDFVGKQAEVIVDHWYHLED